MRDFMDALSPNNRKLGEDLLLHTVDTLTDEMKSPINLIGWSVFVSKSVTRK